MPTTCQISNTYSLIWFICPQSLGHLQGLQAVLFSILSRLMVFATFHLASMCMFSFGVYQSILDLPGNISGTTLTPYCGKFFAK
jgi:hypothetical protein